MKDQANNAHWQRRFAVGFADELGVPLPTQVSS
jgi:hypothetical protein